MACTGGWRGHNLSHARPDPMISWNTCTYVTSELLEGKYSFYNRWGTPRVVWYIGMSVSEKLSTFIFMVEDRIRTWIGKQHAPTKLHSVVSRPTAVIMPMAYPSSYKETVCKWKWENTLYSRGTYEAARTYQTRQRRIPANCCHDANGLSFLI